MMKRPMKAMKRPMKAMKKPLNMKKPRKRIRTSESRNRARAKARAKQEQKFQINQRARKQNALDAGKVHTPWARSAVKLDRIESELKQVKTLAVQAQAQSVHAEETGKTAMAKADHAEETGKSAMNKADLAQQSVDRQGIAFDVRIQRMEHVLMMDTGAVSAPPPSPRCVGDYGKGSPQNGWSCQKDRMTSRLPEKDGGK